MSVKNSAFSFQPTRPLRGATIPKSVKQVSALISTHAPLAGRDKNVSPNQSIIAVFQPTRPLRGATQKHLWNKKPNKISTHAPLAGRDEKRRRIIDSTTDFNPRAPCGARRLRRSFEIIILLFQPTRPLRGATNFINKNKGIRKFQPTRPLRGATVIISGQTPLKRFQPTRPLRGATELRCIHERIRLISTHAPLAGRDYDEGYCGGG